MSQEEMLREEFNDMDDETLLDKFDSARGTLSFHNAADTCTHARYEVLKVVRVLRSVIEERGLTPNKPDTDYLI